MKDNPVPEDSYDVKNFHSLKRVGFVPVAFFPERKTTLFGMRYRRQDGEIINQDTVYDEIMQVFNTNPTLAGLEKKIVFLDSKQFERVLDVYENRGVLTRPIEVVHPDKVLEEMAARETWGVILRNAVKDGATDIHIEPKDRDLEGQKIAERGENARSYRVRIRKEGVLVATNALLGRKAETMLGVIDADTGMAAHDRGVPQDKKLVCESSEYYSKMSVLNGKNLRVSTMPTVCGEKYVVRILDARPSILDLGKLGYSKEMQERILDVANAPEGIFFVTGPTASGKTTTLYSTLKLVITEDDNAVSIEDPPEIRCDFINQVEVNEAKGLTFARAIKTFLRQDPDIILVGEIRDEETVEAAMRAANTGHGVFASLHTNNATSAILRLLDLKARRIDLGKNVQGILAQRLVRVPCSRCGEFYDGTKKMGAFLGDEDFDVPIKLYRGRKEMEGVKCPLCEGTGYKGRTVIPEFWVPGDEEVALIANENISEQKLQEMAIRGGMVPLLDAGITAVIKHKTTLEELLRGITSKKEIRLRKEHLKELIKKQYEEMEAEATPTRLDVPQ